MKNWRLAASLLFVAGLAGACPKGTVEYEGSCASMPSPDTSTLAPMIPTSNEKPPSDKMPSYEREGIHVDEQKPCNDTDHKCSDQQQIDAGNQGKQAAGIK